MNQAEVLKKSADFAGPEGPVVLVIMDGVGIGKFEDGDMVRKATTPHLSFLREHAVCSQLKAHGTAVGLPSDDDMGNSEVGHNAIGCGRVFEQGASLVNQSIETRAMFEGQAWKELIANCKTNTSALHFIGLFSDGNVHSNIGHLKSMLKEAKAEKLPKAFIHILLDGRDVPPVSALEYVDDFEAFLTDINADGSVSYRIASGGGRMNITMDRYNANWDMVRKGWDTHVKAKGPAYATAREAIESLRKDNPGVIDQDLPPFIIGDDGKPVGPIVDGDSVIFFNFRGDRSIEITRAFEEETLTEFDRGPRLNVMYAGMMQYDGDLKLPKRFLVNPPAIDRTMGEYLAHTGLKQLAISETQKFGHVTYFFNGNRSGKFDDNLETYIEVPSDVLPFEQRPWMKAAEITDHVIDAIKSGEYKHIRLNYANGDMVGHTGVYQAVEIAVEAVDLCIGRLLPYIVEAKGILIVSADHGNADDMYERNKKTGQVKVNEEQIPQPKTAHSLNPVPVFIYDPAGTAHVRLSKNKDLGIASIAATIIKCLGYEPPADYCPSIVDVG
ncbi:MAG: 2,3-bisphosphoglycerate-independent phosphoglycerate mutase [Spartobacteria bacterium]|nr:2,3-bisphosphoglycerate-independent phosphoglycerate mutase [Spartobacteria bacterium]